MENYETHSFKVTAETTLHIFSTVPSPGPGGTTTPVYLIKTPTFRAKSKRQPVIVFGTAMTPEIPFEWSELIGRAMGWKVPLNYVLAGAEIAVRVGLFTGKNAFGGEYTGRTLLAVHIKNNEPSEEAKRLIDEKITERKGWFQE